MWLPHKYHHRKHFSFIVKYSEREENKKWKKRLATQRRKTVRPMNVWYGSKSTAYSEWYGVERYFLINVGSLLASVKIKIRQKELQRKMQRASSDTMLNRMRPRMRKKSYVYCANEMELLVIYNTSAYSRNTVRHNRSNKYLVNENLGAKSENRRKNDAFTYCGL